MRYIVMLLVILAPLVGLAADVPNGTWLVNQRIASIFSHAKMPHVGRSSGCGTHHCGRVIIWGLTTDGSSQWNGGWFYNPEDDKTYNLKARMENHDRISARIYEGIPLFGRAEILTRIESRSLAGWCAG